MRLQQHRIPFFTISRRPTSFILTTIRLSSTSTTATRLTINPHIHAIPSSNGPKQTYILSLLPTTPPNTRLSIGSTTSLPPTPTTFTPNSSFLPILQSLIAQHATHDPHVISSAKAFASSGGTTLAATNNTPTSRGLRKRKSDAGAVGGAASAQGGPGGAGVGGWVHVADERNPPDWGRIPYPEDILGSVLVDGKGDFVGEGGEYQANETYRVLTREGMLGLSEYLRERVVEGLRAMEKEDAKV